MKEEVIGMDDGIAGDAEEAEIAEDVLAVGIVRLRVEEEGAGKIVLYFR